MFYPHYKTSIRYTFTLQCPNLDYQLTLSLFHDATVRGDINFYDVCKVADSVTIASNNFPGFFEFHHTSQTMVEYPEKPVKGGTSYIPREWEIIKSFLDHFSLTPTWIDCNFIWGVFDVNTGTWTGAVGKVRSLSLKLS